MSDSLEQSPESDSEIENNLKTADELAVRILDSKEGQETKNGTTITETRSIITRQLPEISEEVEISVQKSDEGGNFVSASYFGEDQHLCSFYFHWLPGEISNRIVIVSKMPSHNRLATEAEFLPQYRPFINIDDTEKILQFLKVALEESTSSGQT
ncbi:MAG: hypothetical protein WD877_00330 [Candidatus Saccharimonadales bacterium]